jgi:sugar transferase EpsL
MPSFVKRFMDILLSASTLLVTAPLIAGTALAIRLKMGKPVFFRQMRPGYKGEPFQLLKFRTMDDSRDARSSLSPDGQRLTPLGRFLRRYSLDELPQLWNVLCGDMSLVGPRPLLVQYTNRYTAEQARRHDVRPGLTGWAQVNGRNSLSWPEKFSLDLWYVDNSSLKLDVRILLRTIRQVLKGEGVSAPGHATMPEFTDNENQKIYGK